MKESAELFCDKSWFQIDAKCKIFLQDLRKWEELVHRNERSKSSGTTTAALGEDIKTAALEALMFRVSWNNILPCTVHHSSRTSRFENEILAYIEARRSQFAFETVSAKSTSDPMEVDSFGKGGKTGKKGKQGKGDGRSGKKEGQHQNQNSNPKRTLFVDIAVTKAI